MRMKNKILLIGAGGIGSFLAGQIYRLIIQRQIDPTTTDVTICDPDTVELKNIKYQDFRENEILKDKSQVISRRYGFRQRQGRIDRGEQLRAFNIILLAVDNNKTREIVYRHCQKNGAYFIDARAEGRAVAVFTKHPRNSPNKLLETLQGEGRNTSCQLAFDLEQGRIQNGNLIAAAIASQLLLNLLRGEQNPPEFRFIF